MKLVSKVTHKFSKARNLIIDPDFCENHKKDFIWICIDDDSTEPMFSLYAAPDGSFTFRSNIWLKNATLEELPAYIANEKKLREVLAFVAADMSEEIKSCI